MWPTIAKTNRSRSVFMSCPATCGTCTTDGTSSRMHVRAASEPVPGQENEDAIFQHGSIVGVLDGVTRPAGLDTGCIHSVAWYVTTLAKSLAGAADTQPSATLADLLAAAITATNMAHADSDRKST